MQYLMILSDVETQQLKPGDPGFDELMAEYAAFGEMVTKLGVIRGGGRLLPTSSATTVRVPVFCSHSESVNVELESPCSAEEARQIMSQFPGMEIVDSPEENGYPHALDATGRDEVFVGRVREDHSVPNGLNLWIVSDNLRKGAALNAIQISEKLVEEAELYLNRAYLN